MHLWYWNAKRLEKTLKEFVGGQMMIDEKDGLKLRGQTSRFIVYNRGEKRILIFVDWLCERKFVVDKFWKPIPKWFPLEPPTALVSSNWLSERKYVLDQMSIDSPIRESYLLEPPSDPFFLDVGFTTYYSQPDEDRLKMFGEFGGICHFFRKNDHTNLVRCGEEFVPYGQIHLLKLRRIFVALLAKKRK
ncbi:MAG TPA: hypothetical protein VK675_01765 [Candidatus Paceibacterota bacterium]|nr:hypothetical protein [Candidatus Paceibacterota bacterium]